MWRSLSRKGLRLILALQTAGYRNESLRRNQSDFGLCVGNRVAKSAGEEELVEWRLGDYVSRQISQFAQRKFL